MALTRKLGESRTTNDTVTAWQAIIVHRLSALGVAFQVSTLRTFDIARNSPHEGRQQGTDVRYNMSDGQEKMA